MVFIYEAKPRWVRSNFLKKEVINFHLKYFSILYNLLDSIVINLKKEDNQTEESYKYKSKENDFRYADF